MHFIPGARMHDGMAWREWREERRERGGGLSLWPNMVLSCGFAQLMQKVSNHARAKHTSLHLVLAGNPTCHPPAPARRPPPLCSL